MTLLLILDQLHRWGFHGQLPIFIQSFLCKLFLGTELACVSDCFEQENGIPQGSVISVILFGVAISSITSTVLSPVQCTLFMDNFEFFCSSFSTAAITRHLQLTVQKLEERAEKMGFQFSADKYLCLHFNHPCCIFNLPDLQLGSTILPFKESVKFWASFSTPNFRGSHIWGIWKTQGPEGAEHLKMP